MKKLLISFFALALSVGGFAQQNERSGKIELNYVSNKELLDIIMLLPDSAFRYWWFDDIEVRKKWYNEIKSNDFWTAEDTTLFNLYFLQPNKLMFRVVDGNWAIYLYKTSDNSFIVITNEGVGDGNTINIFEVKDNKIVKIFSFEDVFGSYTEQLKFDNLSQACNQKLTDVDFEDYFWLFQFSFSDETVEINSSWLIDNKTEFEDCLKGNIIEYKFNPETKKFDIEKIYWKSKK